MAVDASPIHWEVLEFNFCCCFAHLLVATETEIVSRCKEVKFVFGRVRIMALGAVALHHDLVAADSIFGDNVRMARKTNLFDVRCQQLPMRRIMGVVTACTSAVLYGGMNGRHLKFVGEIDMAGQAVFPLSTWLQPEFIVLLDLRGGWIHPPDKTCHREQQK